MIIQPAAAAGNPLLSVGIDVLSATPTTATYKIDVRNEGTDAAINVRVFLSVPPGTTFESSNPPSSQPDGSPPEAPQTCDDAETREPAGWSCQWFFGTLAVGTQVDVTIVLNLNPLSATNNDATATTAIASVQSTNSTTTSDTDSSLGRRRLLITDDTHVNATEPTNTNHGACPTVTLTGSGAVTTFIDTDSVSTTPPEADVNKLLAAELQMTIAASDYTEQSPGSLPIHAISSGEWGEGAGLCGQGNLGSGAEARTGTTPATSSIPTAIGIAKNTGVVTWNVTTDLDGQSKRGAFQGWRILNSTGAGTVSFHSTEATSTAGTDDTVLDPRLLLVYRKPETAKCVDVDPDITIGHPASEQFLTATVRKSDGATNYARLVSGTSDACNGTPVEGLRVGWTVNDDDNPDIYISNQDGAFVPKNTTNAADIGPDDIHTTTSSIGVTKIGVRLGNIAVFNGSNRVAGCLVASPCATAQEPDTVNGNCQISPQNCTGEDATEDDATLQWSQTGQTPAPDPTSTAPVGPPTVSSFSPTSGPVGTSVTVNGNNFTGARSVRFNGVSAPFTVNSSNQITTTVPSGATDGPISVQNSAGTAVSAANFDVTARPPSLGASSTPASNSSSPAASGSPGSTVGASGLSPVGLNLATSEEQTIAFTEVALSGSLTSDNPACAQPGTTVELFKREAESTTLEHLAYVNTGVGGFFEHKVIPEASTIYVASVGEHAACAGAESTPVTLLVSPQVTIKSTSRSVVADRSFWVSGKVLPEHQLTAVTLWRKVGPGEWTKLAKDYLDSASRYSFSVRYIWRRARSVFVVRWKSTDADHESGKSPWLRIERA